MKIAIASDHRGVEAVAHLVEHLRRLGHEVNENIEIDPEVRDYPDPAHRVGSAVAGGAFDRGILICGTGIGMSIAANKVKGVRAAVVHDELMAQLSRSHNDANVLCLSADLLGEHRIDSIVEKFLDTPFDGGRHDRRVRKIAAIESGQDPGAVT